MDAALFDNFLYRGEGDSLDYKVDQYAFEKADDEEKSELLKDILAFANSWCESDAYILIGVEEVRGGKSVVHGITKHLKDHELQQFVAAKTKRPLRFRYEDFSFDGKHCGVICIPRQERPQFLTKNFGKLKAGVVYIRRGSSTGEADPEEVAKMGRVQTTAPKPTFEVHAKANVVKQAEEIFYCLEIELINIGTGTAGGLEVEADKAFHRFNNMLWQWRQSAPKRWRLKLKEEFHADDRRELAGWRLGNAVLRPETKFQIQKMGRYDPAIHGARYDDGDFHMELIIFTKDSSRIFFNIDYTLEEINSKIPKVFSPVPRPS